VAPRRQPLFRARVARQRFPSASELSCSSSPAPS
jgi:hypothetical protein